jgi:hypothetical protein
MENGMTQAGTVRVAQDGAQTTDGPFGAEFEELLDALADVTAQGCYAHGGAELYSGHLSAYGDALRLLAQYCRVKIVQERGKSVWANWVRRGADE